jgi:hypothetical protein
MSLLQLALVVLVEPEITTRLTAVTLVVKQLLATFSHLQMADEVTAVREHSKVEIHAMETLETYPLDMTIHGLPILVAQVTMVLPVEAEHPRTTMQLVRMAEAVQLASSALVDVVAGTEFLLKTPQDTAEAVEAEEPITKPSITLTERSLTSVAVTAQQELPI